MESRPGGFMALSDLADFTATCRQFGETRAARNVVLEWKFERGKYLADTSEPPTQGNWDFSHVLRSCTTTSHQSGAQPDAPGVDGIP